MEFDPKTIDKIDPNGKTNVTATITPADKAVAGDYMTTVTATTKAVRPMPTIV